MESLNNNRFNIKISIHEHFDIDFIHLIFPFYRAYVIVENQDEIIISKRQADKIKIESRKNGMKYLTKRHKNVACDHQIQAIERRKHYSKRH